ncbi:hypothetical protein [Alicyclobacillus sp. ALC3]|uniref:hypothetical protein n=1 Tax=Alicyclobacillus sp. ALC3 TaxID=2796143 RepID=UPI0023793E00|nr:hypothetical protein [Alicyclobacillus sp. ALC3]WDL99195.1 hypothetical protein JC200_11440 [Alicyclobacillus sp. ALC3]
MAVALSILAWLVLIVLNVRLARKKNRNVWLWGILSVVTGGLVFLWTIILSAMKPKVKKAPAEPNQTV